MPAFAFDTHAAVKNLTGAGFDTAQAEAITDTVRDAVVDSVATRADVDAIGTRLVNVEERLDNVDKRLDNVDKRLDNVDQRLDNMDKRLDNMDKRLDNVDKRLDNVDKRFDKMDKRFDKIEARLDTMVTREDLENYPTKADIANLKVDILKIALAVAVGVIATNAALTLTLFRLFGGAN